MINKWKFCAGKLAKSAIYGGIAFIRKIGENYVRDDELYQKLC